MPRTRTCLLLMFIVVSVLSCGDDNDNKQSTEPDDGTFILAWTGTSDNSINEFKLHRIKLETGSVEIIGGSGFFTSLCYGPDGTLYGISDGVSIIDPSNGETERLFSFLPEGVDAMLMAEAAMSPSGDLYVLENWNRGPNDEFLPQRLYRVDLTSGAMTLLGQEPEGVLWAALEFDGAGDLYTGFSHLYKLNPTSGATVMDVGVFEDNELVAYFTPSSESELLGSDFAVDDPTLFTVNTAGASLGNRLSLPEIGIRALVLEEEQGAGAKTPALRKWPKNGIDRSRLLRLEREHRDARHH